MATYVVTLKPALEKGGKILPEQRTVSVVAPDSRTAMQIAEGKGWSAFRATPEVEKRKKQIKPFPRKPLIMMCNSLAAMLDAQIPLPRALEFYLAHLRREDLRLTLKSIAAAVDRGDENYKAFAATGRFDSTFIGLVRAGTMASNLSAAFRGLARQLKTHTEFQAKLRKALFTPCGVMAFQWCLLMYSMNWLVPMVEKMLKDMRATPDPFSGAVFAFSHFFQAVYIPATIGIIVFALVCWRSPSFRALIVKVLLSRWKLIREIIRGFRQLTFLGTFEMLTSNNIPIADALDSASRALQNTPHEKELQTVKSKLALGMNLGEAVRRYTTFDLQLSHMVEIGEKSSNLGEQLRLLRDLYEEETAQRIEFFTGFIGVASKVATVSMIAAIYLGTYMPIIFAGIKMMTSGGL